MKRAPLVIPSEARDLLLGTLPSPSRGTRAERGTCFFLGTDLSDGKESRSLAPTALGMTNARGHWAEKGKKRETLWRKMMM